MDSPVAGAVVAVAVVGAPAISLAVCFGLAFAFADIGGLYFAGIPVAPAVTAAYASKHGTRGGTRIWPAIASCLITIAAITILLVLFLMWVASGFKDFD